MPPASATMTKTTLIDVTRCIGCRACQVACKNWNDCEGEQTELLGHLGLQNPASLSADTLTLITSHEIPDEHAPGGLLIPLHHAALPALPGAGLRVRLPDHRAEPHARRAGQLRRGQVHRLPLLHVGLPVGRAGGGMGLARPEDQEMHPLRGPAPSSRLPRAQRAGAHRGGHQGLREDACWSRPA